MAAKNILVVDDEAPLADLVEVYLKNEGFHVFKFYTATDALETINREAIDLALLDVMLPDMDGFELCRQIRLEHNFPIIMLTAKTSDADKITGLTIGADDYLTKPFNPMELVARVKAQLRRSSRYNQSADKPDEDEDHIDFNGLIIDRITHECTLYDQPVTLTPTEFDILWLLAKNCGRVISSEELFEIVWGEKFLDSNNTVMVHIRRIREKLHDKPKDPKFNKTIWGVGYKIEK